MKSRHKVDRRKVFVQEYLKDLNGAQAAIRAGYSKKTAKEQAARLLTNVNLREEIQKAMDARAKRSEVNADGVLQEIKKLAFANMLDYIRPQEDGSCYVDLSNLTRDQAAAIQEVVVEEYTEGRGQDARQVRRTKFKLCDKGMNLERLGKHLKLFTDKYEHDVTDRIVVDFRNATDAELERIIKGAEALPAMWD